MLAHILGQMHSETCLKRLERQQLVDSGVRSVKLRGHLCLAEFGSFSTVIRSFAVSDVDERTRRGTAVPL